MTAPTLTEFLLARIAEDEAAAREVTDFFYSEGRWKWGHALPVKVALLDDRESVVLATRDDGPTWMACDHIARHDPARVLAECEAKRRIVQRHALREFFRPGGADALCTHCRDSHPCADLRDLASVYADHPDYREEWRG